MHQSSLNSHKNKGHSPFFFPPIMRSSVGQCRNIRFRQLSASHVIITSDMAYFQFRKLMYRSGDPFTIPLELYYITKRETSKAKTVSCGDLSFPKHFARGKTRNPHSKPNLNTKDLCKVVLSPIGLWRLEAFC